MSTKLVSYFFLRLAGRLGSTASSVVSVSGCASATSTTSGCATGASTGVTSATVAVATGGVSTHSGSAGTLTSGAVPYPSIFPLRSLLLFLYHE